MKKWAIKAFDENGDTFIHRPVANAKEAGQLIAEVLMYDREGGVGGVTVLRSTSLTVEDEKND